MTSILYYRTVISTNITKRVCEHTYIHITLRNSLEYDLVYTYCKYVNN